MLKFIWISAGKEQRDFSLTAASTLTTHTWACTGNERRCWRKLSTWKLFQMDTWYQCKVLQCVCVCVWVRERERERETRVVLLWGRQHERPWQFQISCCRWIFINNICQWNIPSLCLCVSMCVFVCVCVHASYYLASRPSGMCRFQKNSSSIFMRVYAFINVAANCLRSNSQLVSASTRVYLTDRETKKKKMCVCVC